MAKFIGIHEMGGPFEESLMEKSWATYKEACEKLDLKAIRVDYNTQKGVAHCITEADSEKDVHQAHEDANKDMMPKEIFEVSTLD